MYEKKAPLGVKFKWLLMSETGSGENKSRGTFVVNTQALFKQRLSAENEPLQAFRGN
jgi:hypothetical protein